MNLISEVDRRDGTALLDPRHRLRLAVRPRRFTPCRAAGDPRVVTAIAIRMAWAAPGRADVPSAMGRESRRQRIGRPISWNDVSILRSLRSLGVRPRCVKPDQARPNSASYAIGSRNHAAAEQAVAAMVRLTIA